MKKTITILLIIMSVFISNAQVDIISASEKTCPGIDIEVNFKWDQSNGISVFRIDYLKDNGVLGACIWEVENSTFYNLEKKIIAGDTIYTKNLSTQLWYPFGEVALSCVNNSTNIELKCSDVTGISEYDMVNSKPVYYNFTGEIVDPKPGQILILKQGNTVKKVLIHE